MSNRKLAKAMQHLTREVQKLYRQFNRAAVNWLLRSAFVANRRGQSPMAGFALPVSILLILVLTLTVGAMTLRAFDRNLQVITSAQEKVIYNSATPAIDRARSKLEFLFDAGKDSRYPGGTPFESYLVGMLANNGTNGVAAFTIDDGAGTQIDPYKLPDEQRLDIGSPNSAALDGIQDNAWKFRTDTNGDGKTDATIVYSIIFSTPSETGGKKPPELLLTLSDQAKADLGIVRNGPLSSQTRLTGCGSVNATADSGFTKEAWFEDVGNTSLIRKNFQVNTIVIPDDPKAATVTMEFQQDRQIVKGNKWGAWFRYDLEIFPGPVFNWNGAMHTEGNLIFGGQNKFTAYLVSSKNSCLYQPESSELSVTDQKLTTEGNLGDFKGLVASGEVGKGISTASVEIHVQTTDNGNPVRKTLKETNDASLEAGTSGNIASDPVTIVLEERTQSVNATDRNNRTQSAWDGEFKTTNADGILPKRFNSKAEKVPFVDDLYRADDRWGPKPKYADIPGGGGVVPAGTAIGTPIPAGNTALISTPAPTGKVPAVIGLDGYWERRAYAEGLRVLVGERLELGNIGGWVTPRDVPPSGSIVRDNYITPPNPSTSVPVTLVDESTPGATPDKWTELDGDPLYPPTVAPYPFRSGTALPHLTQQRRSLRDNIPAVQSAAVYHAAVGQKDYPVACMAMTVHPGTQNTLRQSINFFPTNFKNNGTNNDTYLLSDFFNGRGTDGWEYAPPGGDVTQFVGQLAGGQPLRIALDNLANFAGDKQNADGSNDGAFPPKQEAGRIHPYPALTMWGNYSNLKRALAKLDASGYNALSIADKSYIQTAACSIGMLATNVDQLQKFDPTNPNNDVTWNNAQSQVISDLGDKLTILMNGKVEDGEVLPKARLSTYAYNAATANPDLRLYKAEDYYEVPPEAFIAGLKQQVIAAGGDYLNSPLIRMAELIMTSQQVRRDRTFGFRPSPAFGEYALAFNTNTADPIKVFPSACDPDLFALADLTVPVKPFGGRAEKRFITSVVNPAINWNLKPFALATAPPATAYANADAFPGAVAGDLSSLSGRRLALSRLCGAIRMPLGILQPNGTVKKYQPGEALGSGFDPRLRPVVLPKFPSLYYIFPEVAHRVEGVFTGDTNTDGLVNRPGEYDHRQPGAIGPAGSVSTALNNANDDAAAAAGLNPFDREPYITDAFINANTYVFTPVSAAATPNPRLAAYPAPLEGGGAIARTVNTAALPALQAVPTTPFFSRFPYANTSPFPTPDLPVSAIALAPRQISGFPAGATPAVLPSYAPNNSSNDTSPNRIMVPSSPAVATANVRQITALPTKPWAVPFLDWAMFDGRQLQVARVTDIDWGMLRSTNPAVQSDGTEFANNEPWLPMSGIVYAFREDAVREDGIARPPSAAVAAGTAVSNNQLIAGNAMNISANPIDPRDPALQRNNISVKSIDHLPDPYRRVHGFRMRNGTQLKRNPNAIGGTEAAKNVRGLSFVTDQPVYILGDFNLHQEGNGNETVTSPLLEEFAGAEKLPTDRPYEFNEFYNRATRDPKFATTNDDRWRPSEILADSISILSNSYCDGSIADAFVGPSPTTNSIPDFQASNGGGGNIQYPGNIQKSVYNQIGLYAPGCSNGAGNTSYQNQNRVKESPSTNAQGWEWKREGASFVSPPGTNGNQPSWSDFTTPIQIGRTGEPLLVARPINQNPTLPVNYGLGGFNRPYATPAEGRGTRLVADAAETRINAIIVSGLTPSRINQSYGGLHNFPRFVESWNGKRFFFSGSFLQLNFSNYATGPFDQEGWEPSNGANPATTNEFIPHYQPPNRLWGYDVALQFAPAGPIAARFVAPSSTRSEFYTEPPISDPYINKLCVAAKAADPTLKNVCISQRN